MNARVAKESIEHICNILAFFGVRILNAETFRQAKLGEAKVVDKLWIGLFQLILLHTHNFKVRLNSTIQSTAELQQFVTYALYRYKCPFHLQSQSQNLLLAFGFLMNHVDLFGKYDSFFIAPPTGITSTESINSLTSEFIQNALPPSSASWSSILTLHKQIMTEIRSTYMQLYYTAKLINRVHDTDPSLDPEDIWISSSEERIQAYTEIMAEAERIDQRKEEEFKLRANFWKWIEGVIDSVEDVNEVNAAETCPIDFPKILEGIQQNFKFICSVWEEIKSVMDALDAKMRALVQESPECASEIEKVFQEMSTKFSTFEACAAKVLNSGEIPTIVPIVSSLVKERSEADVALAKKVESLLQDLTKAQNTTKLAVYKVMNSVPGVKTYGL